MKNAAALILMLLGFLCIGTAFLYHNNVTTIIQMKEPVLIDSRTLEVDLSSYYMPELYVYLNNGKIVDVVVQDYNPGPESSKLSSTPYTVKVFLVELGICMETKATATNGVDHNAMASFNLHNYHMKLTIKIEVWGPA